MAETDLRFGVVGDPGFSIYPISALVPSRFKHDKHGGIALMDVESV